MSDDYESRNTSLAIGTTSLEVSPTRDVAQDNRTLFLYRNNSPNVADVITLSFGKNKAVVGGGGLVLEKGQAYGEDENSQRCWKGSIQGVCATANGVLSIMER